MVAHPEPLTPLLVVMLGEIFIAHRPKVDHRAVVEHHVFLILAGTRVNLIQMQLHGLAVDLLRV